MANEVFDVLVVGGGITGAGVALEAAARGLSVALAERGDIARGTSSRSSKLIHGGLRYLQSHEIGLVAESLAERQRLLENAPHLVTPLPFLIPLFGRDGVVNRTVARTYGTALWMYDLAGGWRIGRRHRRVGRDEVIRHLPTMRSDRLVAGFLYYDARADDARLTLAVLRSASEELGAAVATYAPVTRLLPEAGDQAVSGALISPLAPGEDPGDSSLGTSTVEVRARAVVNATGIWADDLIALDQGSHPNAMRPAKGIHIAVPREKLPCDIAVVVPVAADRRSIFVIPWGTHTYIGTTDTDYEGSMDEPDCTEEDVSYILDALNAALGEPIELSDVTGAWAGLRPLLNPPGGTASTSSRTADLSRRHVVKVSERGLVTVTGGKLTTYRKMASDTVDVVVDRLGRGARRSPTKTWKLHGADGTAQLRAPGSAARLGIAESTLEHLISRHGGEARALWALVEQDSSLGEPLVPGLPYLRAEAIFAVREEWALTLEDILARRTRALLLDAGATLASARDVAELIAPELGWSAEDIARHVNAFRDSSLRFYRAGNLAGAQT